MISLAMIELTPIFGILGFFTSVIIFVYMYFSSRHKIRMAIIENDKDMSIFHQMRSSAKNGSLKWGLVAFSAGLGLIVGYFLENLGFPGEVAYFSMIFLF